MSALWRARGWILLPVILVTALAVLWLSSVQPLYRSAAKLIVESQETAYTRPSSTTNDLAILDEETIKSQVQLILSSDLNRKVINDLGLAKLPEFNPDSAPSLISRVLSIFGVTRDYSDMTTTERVLEKYFTRLAVYQIGTSRVIAIEFSSEDPELAALVANTLADSYIDMQKTAKRDATREASEWLRGQIDSLRGEVDDAERKVETFRTENGLFSSIRGTSEPQMLSTQQLSELTTQLALARAAKSEAQARARLIRDMIDSGGPIDSTEVLNSLLIQNLVQQQVSLRAQIAELSTTYGSRHPRMQEMESQLGDLRRQIRDEAVKYARAAENDAAVAAEREQALLEGIESLQTSVAESNRAEVELRALERDAKSQRDLLESLLARYRDAAAREDLDALPADARLISRAAPAVDPYYPKTLATLMAAFLGSLILSCGIVITLELVRSVNAYPGFERVPTPADHVPPMAARQPQRAESYQPHFEPQPDVPETTAKPPGRPEATTRPEATPRSEARTLSETVSGYPVASPRNVTSSGREPAWRGDLQGAGTVDPTLETIRDEIVERSGGDLAHTVLFTSVHKNDHLADVAMRLARSVAAMERRVMVVDAELTIHHADAAEEDRPGLGNLLNGASEFEAAIQRDRHSRVHVIPAGQIDGDPLIQLSSERMDTILEALRQTYDVVILLAPAVIRHGEARLLARRADQAVLVLDESAGESTTQRAQDRLLDAGLVDVAMLKVDSDGPNLTAA